MNELIAKLEQLEDVTTDLQNLCVEARKLCEAEIARLEALV